MKNIKIIFFLGILFLSILTLGMLYVSYLKDVHEGFDKQRWTDISSNSIAFIKNLPETLLDISKNILKNDIDN